MDGVKHINSSGFDETLNLFLKASLGLAENYFELVFYPRSEENYFCKTVKVILNNMGKS